MTQTREPTVRCKYTFNDEVTVQPHNIKGRISSAFYNEGDKEPTYLIEYANKDRQTCRVSGIESRIQGQGRAMSNTLKWPVGEQLAFMEAGNVRQGICVGALLTPDSTLYRIQSLDEKGEITGEYLGEKDLEWRTSQAQNQLTGSRKTGT